MKNFLSLLALLFTIYSANAQQDTLVYYKNQAPQTTAKGADYQIIVRKKNKNTSVLQRAKFRDGKWEVTQTETIKLKKPNLYYSKGGKYQYHRKFEKIAGGYRIHDSYQNGKQSNKGISRSLFPLHREGQWNVYSRDKQIGVNRYKEDVLINSYFIGENKKRFPTNTYANADSLASYKGGIKSFSSYLTKKTKYPNICQQNKLEALVIVLFAIDANGAPTDFHIQSETNQYFNQAAITAIQSCGKWKPAMKDNKAVSVYNIVPVNFRLR